MDQVLQVNTGERKEGIKTGAADSIVLACLREQVDERRGTEAVILATNDKRLRSLCSQLFGDAVLLAGNIGDLLTKLNVFEPAEGELQEEVQQELEDRIRDARSQVGASLQTFEMGFRIDSDGEAASDRHPPRASRVLAQLGRVEIVELHGLRVSSQDGDERSGLADVRVFAEVHITQLELRDTAMGASEWVTTFDDAVDGAFIDLNIALIFDRHWQVRSASPAGPAVIVFRHYDDDDSDQVPDFHASAVESYGV